MTPEQERELRRLKSEEHERRVRDEHQVAQLPEDHYGWRDLERHILELKWKLYDLDFGIFIFKTGATFHLEVIPQPFRSIIRDALQKVESEHADGGTS